MEPRRLHKRSSIPSCKAGLRLARSRQLSIDSSTPLQYSGTFLENRNRSILQSHQSISLRCSVHSFSYLLAAWSPRLLYISQCSSTDLHYGQLTFIMSRIPQVNTPSVSRGQRNYYSPLATMMRYLMSGCPSANVYIRVRLIFPCSQIVSKSNLRLFQTIILFFRYIVHQRR